MQDYELVCETCFKSQFPNGAEEPSVAPIFLHDRVCQGCGEVLNKESKWHWLSTGATIEVHNKRCGHIVYGVTRGEYSDYGIAAIFSTELKAQCYLAKLAERDPRRDLRIEEFRMDPEEVR